MKKLSFLLLIAFILIGELFFPGKIYGIQLYTGDDYGKVIGQLVDAKTGEPVNEPFFIFIYYGLDDNYPRNYLGTEETDNQGKFELKMTPFTYYLNFCPISITSKYAQTKYPYCVSKRERDTIKVEKGKITYYKRKINLGGVLKIYTADMNNVRFILQEKYKQKFKIRKGISNDLCKALMIRYVGALEKGELGAYRLYTGEYNISLRFEGLGFKNFQKKNIQVEAGKVTEVNVNLDLEDKTGVEGIVTDKIGNLIYNAEIIFGAVDIQDDSKIIGFEAFTNGEGYYILTGIPAGKYHVSVMYRPEPEKVNKGLRYGYFFIEKNVLKRLDFQLNLN